MDKENIEVDCNYQYFNSNKQWTLLGYLRYCDKQKILRSRCIEHKKFNEYFNYIVKNIPTKKKQGVESKRNIKISWQEAQS
ncbi:hypothetical protein F8M41_023121 [Gigaspora margarita]|uniref:Uncharacterized protein n=1 Tax=Gigaspora margarita TaxID=4874 RepID=A0A8H4EHG2_GIGMA|nr:hypothetical protein F8M41_023121 [Gigaspora margarita]